MYYIYLGATAGLMAAIIAFTYMAGKLLNDKGLIGRARMWLGDFVENIIILVLVLAVYSATHVVSQHFIDAFSLPTLYSDNVDWREDTISITIHLLEMVREEVVKLTVITGEIYHNMELFKNLKENWGFPGVDVTLRFYSAADYYEGPISWALKLGALVYTSTSAQELALRIIKYIAYPLIMFSLVFRFLNVFREAANTLIAIALAYSALFPFLYTVLVVVLDMYLETQFSISIFTASHMPVCAPLLHNIFTRAITLFLPVVPYFGPCMLGVMAAVAAAGAAVIVIPTFLISITNAFVDALGYMLNLEYRAGMI